MGFKEDILEFNPFNEQEEMDKKWIIDFMEKYDDVLTRENIVAHFTVSNWVVNKDRTKILMIHHNIYNSWGWTGGHSDGDSDFRHVALKELEEESGIKNAKILTDKFVSLELVTVNGHVKKGKYVSPHIHINVTYLVEADENEVLKIKADENSGVKWVNIEDVYTVTNEPKMVPIYKKLNEKLKMLGV